jgi:large repetitive protein
MNRGILRLTPRSSMRIGFHGQGWARHAAGRNGLAVLVAMLLLVLGAHAQSTFGPEPVGTASAAQTVTVPITTAGTETSVEVLTQGAAGLDFAVGTGTSNCTGSLAASTTCSESVTFTPTAPGVRYGAVVVVGTVASTTTVLGTAFINGTGTGALGVLVPGDTIPVAGQADTYLGSVGDGGPATSAVLYLPSSEAIDGVGNLYIADTAHNRIRMVCAKANSAVISGTTCSGAGIISTIAGNGDGGYSGNGPASSSTVSSPGGVAVDGAGDVYVADTGNNVIREIVAATGEIVTVAGGATTVCPGKTDSVGDGCPALQATLNGPLGVSLDSSGNIYIADTNNELIRMVALSTGNITAVAGDGYINSTGTGGYNGDGIKAITAELNTPYAVAFDASGNMYIPDSANNRIRLVTAISGAITPASLISTFAGDGTQGYEGDGGLAASAELWAPSGVALDAAGNVYIADTQNQAIRKVNSASGNIETLIKSGEGSVYFNGNFGVVGLYGPTGISLDSSGDVYLADTLDMVIREVQSNFTALDYKTAVRQGSQSGTIPVTIENDGNADFDITAITPSVNAQVDATTTTCVVAPPAMDVSTDCIVGAIFAPTVSGDPLTANIDVTSETLNSPLDILLVGNAEAVNSTTTAVTSAPNPSNFGQSVTFTVTVTTGAGTGSLTGTVSIADTYNGVTTTLASGLALNASGVATFAITTLGVGQHSIVASYSGDSAHFASTSTANGVAPLIQVVNENTSTTLTTSVNPSAPGQNVTFTATVAISGGGGVTPDGTVTFMDGTTVLGTVALASGTATYSTATLAIGIHPITAVFSGDASNEINGSTSKVLNQDVQAPSTIALVSSLNPSTYGTSVTFTATITSSATTGPTGTVNFYDGTTKIGSGTLSGSPAVATFATATLSVGTHSITAVYVGDANNSSGTSNVVSQVVNKATSNVAIASSLNPSNLGQNVTFTVTVTAATGTGTLNGTVTITDTFNGNTTNLATGLAVNGSGVATYQTAALAVGSHSIVATYSGDTDHATSTSSPALIQTLDESTTVALVSSLNPSVFGQNVTFTATVTVTGSGTVTPDGTVSFMDGTTLLGTGTLAAGVATYQTAALAVGVHSITAVYGGDAANGVNASTSAVLKQDVQASTTVTVVSSLNPSDFGQNVTFTATVASSATTAPTGSVIFLDNGKQIGTGTLTAGVATLATAALAVGTHPITVTYAGDANNGAGATAAPLNQLVNTTVTATTVAAVPNPGIANEAVAITATVKVTTGAATPTGTVTFTSGATTLGTTALTAAGTATINPTLAEGTYTVVATYSGDTDDGGSASTALTLVVNLAGSATTLTVTPNPAVIDTAVTFTAAVTGNGVAPTGTVTFMNGATTLGSGTLSASGSATFTTSTLAVGNYTVTAVYSGDANNSPSTSASVSLAVTLIPTTTGLATSSTTGANPQTILIAVVEGTTGPTPTGTVTFTDGGTVIGSATLDSSGVATLTPNLPTGNYLIVAGYGGDSLHSPSTSTPVAITGAPAGFNLSVTPATVSLQASQNATLTINLTSEGGFTDTIGLGCGSLPAGVTCTFSSNSVKLAANTTATAQLSIDTNSPIGGGATAMNRRSTPGASLAGLFMPLSAFFGWLFWRLRRRTMGFLTMILVLALSAGALLATGCSGYSSSTAAPGTYVIQVTGTGTSSDVIHYQNITLTITK